MLHQPLDRGGRRQVPQRRAPARRWPARARAAGRRRRLPERHLARLARRGRDEHAVVGDLLDAPASRRRAGTSRRRGSRTPSPRRARRRARAGPRSPSRNTPYSPRSGIVPPLMTATRFAPSRAVSVSVSAIPREARPQLGELVGRIAARQHVEHALEDARGSARRTAPRADAREQLVDVPRRPSTTIATICCASDVERVARIAGRLRPRLVHRPRDGGAGDAGRRGTSGR